MHRSHWTTHHYCWLERAMAGLSGSLKVHLELLLRQLQGFHALLTEYGRPIEAMARQPRFEKSVQALTCDTGIKQIFALTMIPEIGDVRHFAHPRQLVSWMGMDIQEYSSGGKPNRFGITKQGNRYLPTAFIEANQRGFPTTRLRRELKARRAQSLPEFVAIADRCLRRLTKKAHRLLLAGKHPNKVKVACARETVGFVWESLHRAAL